MSEPSQPDRGWTPYQSRQVILLGLAALVVAGYFYARWQGLYHTGEQTGYTDTSKLVSVLVSGEVKKAGLHQVPSGSRVRAVLEGAGPRVPLEELSQLWLDLPVSEGQALRLYKDGNGVAQLSLGRMQGRNGGLIFARTEVNQATREELESVPGIGPATAEAIVKYRETHGPFTSLEGLEAVPGIGPKRLDQLRAELEVKPVSP